MNVRVVDFVYGLFQKGIVAWLVGMFLFIGFFPSVVRASGERDPDGVEVTSTAYLRILIDGTQSSQKSEDGIVYLGGSFATVTLEGADPVSRANFVAIDTHNRVMLDTNLSFNDRVEDIEITESWIVVVGRFTRVNDTPQPYIALIDKKTYQLVPAQISVNAPVYGVARWNNTLFFGGQFTVIQKGSRSSVASIQLPDLTLNRWNPRPNAPVYAVRVKNDTLYLGGAFTRIADADRPYAAAFALPSGTLLSWKFDAPTGEIYRLRFEGEEIMPTYLSDLPEDIAVIEISVGADGSPAFGDDTGTSTLPTPSPATTRSGVPLSDLMINTEELGFKIPSLGDVLTFAIRIFFVIAGLAALFYMILGAFAWITSGGDKDSVTAAREKIQSAVIGLIMIVAVLAVVWTLEQVIFNRRICLGVSCPLTIPSLLQPLPTAK